MIYQKLLKTVGKNQAKQYAQIHQQAIARYRILVEKYHMDCEWRECPACLYAKKAETKREKEQAKQWARALRDEYHAARELGIPAERKKETELPFPVEEALYFPEQACFHPLKFLRVLAEGVQVFENTRVMQAGPHVLVTNRGRVRAGKIVFACHYPFVNRPGYYFLRMHQERSYVVALEGAARMRGMYLGIDREGFSFRTSGNLLLLGGGGHRTGETPCKKPYESLLHRAEQYWPEARKRAQWSAQDCMTLDGIPYIGKFGWGTEDWFVATGFGKWGMTSSMAAALILTDLVCGRENPYAEVFSPQRLHAASSAKTFFRNGIYASAGLLRENVMPPKEQADQIRPGEGGIVEYKGKKRGIYKNEKGQIFVVSTKCPHMGCQLAWNPEEKSWDCPCHGSRFDYQGRLLNEPAQTKLPFAAGEQ